MKKISPGEQNIQGMGVITAMTKNSFSLEVYNMYGAHQPVCLGFLMLVKYLFNAWPLAKVSR